MRSLCSDWMQSLTAKTRMSADPLSRPLRRYFWLYTAGFCALLGSLAILEHEGFPRFWLGYLFN